METELTTYAIACLAALIAGISKGGFGGGVAFVSTPLVAISIGPAAAAAVMLPVLILIDQVGIRSYWRRWDWPSVRPLLLFAAFGIGAGALAFGTLSADALKLGLGLIALLFLIFQLARARGWAPKPPQNSRGGIGAALWGTMAGITSTISHAGGPPVTIYLLSRHLDKGAYQASAVLIFWAVNLMKVGPYIALGAFDGASLLFSASLVPAALAGFGLGLIAHRHVPETLFFRAVSVLLACTAAKLIWDGITGLAG